MAEKELQQLQTKVEGLLEDGATSLAELDHIYKRITTEIREVKCKIISLLNNLEQKSLNELNKFKIDLSEKIKSEIQMLNNTKAEMLEILSKLRKPNIDDSLLFARLKQSKELIQDKKQSIADIANTRHSEKVRFVADTKLLDCMHSLQDLGVLKCDSYDKQHTQGVGKVSEIARGQGPSSLILNQPYTVIRKTSFNVKIKEDRETSDIWGMCQMPDGSIIIADYSNKRLKQLGSTTNVISHCPLSAYPCDVCNTKEGEVAVALKGKTIHFVAVGDKLTAKHSFSTGHDCWSLSHHNTCLYVVSDWGSEVYVYKPSGSLLHTISTDQYGTQLFSHTWYITVSPVSGRLYVADLDKGLVIVDTQGNFLATFKPPILSQGAASVCLDGAGNVFVGECHTNNVLQVREEGDKEVTQIMSKSDGKSPWRLSFDNFNTRIIVSSGTGSDHVTVLQLAQNHKHLKKCSK